MAQIATFGGRGIGVNPEGTDYPFVDPQDDIRGLLADAFVAHEVQGVELPLRIAWMQGFEHAFVPVATRADVRIEDGIGTLIFDSLTSDSYRQTDFGTRLRIHEWTTDDVAVCRIVQHTAFEDDEDAYTIPNIIYPVNGILDERVSQLLPKRVTSLNVNLQTFRGSNIKLTNGYNTFLFAGDLTDRHTVLGVPMPTAAGTPVRATTDELRPPTRITLDANAGDGLGTFPGCAEVTQAIKRINSIGPDHDGDFLLSGDECYYVRRPTTLLADFTTRPAEATLNLGNNCGPCCECVEFARTYKGVRRLWLEFSDLGSRAEAVRDLYKENLARWRVQKDCRESKPLRLVSDILYNGDQLIVYVAGSICNTTGVCIHDIDLRLELDWICDGPWGSSEGYPTPPAEPDPPNEPPDECTTTIAVNETASRKHYTPTGTWPAYTFEWCDLDSGRSVNFKARLVWDNCHDLPCKILELRLRGRVGTEVLPQIPETHHIIDCKECN